MQDLFDQDRPLTLGAVKLATGIFGLLLFLTAIATVIGGLGTIIGGDVLKGLTRIVTNLTVLFFLFLLIRLLGENLAALHRMNDRMRVLGDDVRVRRAPPQPDVQAEAPATKLKADS